MKRVDLTGKRFGMLVVLQYSGLDTGGNASWDCVCDCGATVSVRGSRLRSGETASCGCLRRNHAARGAVVRGDGSLGKGDAHRLLYATWTAMRARCNSPTHPAYKSYGGRGIRVCDRWMDSFDNFAADVGQRPFPGAELDRKDNNGNYEPENCRWVTRKNNSRNRRSSKLIDTPQGPMLLCEASEVSGIKEVTIAQRVRAGWPADRLFDPARPANDNAAKSVAS